MIVDRHLRSRPSTNICQLSTKYPNFAKIHCMLTATAKENRITALLQQFKSIVGDPYVSTDEETLANYGHDETENLLYLPDVVLRPRTAEEISAIMIICHEHRIPVTP